MGPVFFCKGVANLFFKGVAIVLVYSEAQKPGPSLGPLVPGSSGALVLWSSGPLALQMGRLS